MLAFVLQLIFLFAARCPRALLLACGTCLGWLWFYVIPIRRGWTLAHLRAAGDPTWTVRVRRRMARRVFVNQAQNVVEMLGWRRLLATRGDVPWVRVEGRKHLMMAREQGRGVLILSAHLGHFDLIACQQALREGGLHVVSKTLSWHVLNRVWMRARAALGLHVLEPGHVMAPALTALRQNDVVAFVLDQHSPEPRAVDAPFLGHPARTSAALALLALRAKAPIVPCFTRRDRDGTHHVWFAPALTLPTEGTLRTRVETVTIQCLAVIEETIRDHPEQWLWLHRRWKTVDGKPLIALPR